MSDPTAPLGITRLVRVAIVGGFDPPPRGFPTFAPPALAWPAKDPADTLDYTLDLSLALAGDTSDSVADVDVQIAPSEAGGVSLVKTTADGAQAIIWLTGGFAGTVYSVSVIVRTMSGRVVSRSVLLPVDSLTQLPVPAMALTDQNGNPITDQSGGALLV